MESNCKKTTYRTSQLAWEDLERIKAKNTREKCPKRAYKCKKCGNFHLTSRNTPKDKINDLKFQVFILKKKLAKSKENLASREEELFKRIEEIKKLKFNRNAK